MINIWDYAKELPKVVIETLNGKIYKGEVVCVDDADEGEDEDSITIELNNGQFMGFYPSEIKSIKKADE